MEGEKEEGRGGRRKKRERREKDGGRKGQNLPVALTRPVRLAATGKCFFKIILSSCLCCDCPPFGVSTSKTLDL